MATQEIVRLEDVWVRYNGTPVLEGITLSILEHDFLGIIGPNGGGKTTLLKVILGLIKPQHGTVLVLGKPPEQSRRYIGYVPQYFLFDRSFPANVLEVVLMGRYGRTGPFHRYSQEDVHAAEQALARMGMLSFRDRQIGALSGGQQQRVFIARALVAEPKLLLLDEPMASVAQDVQTEFYELLDTLKKTITIVMVSHDIGAISVYVDKIACLNSQLCYHGSKEISAEVLEATYKCPVQLIAHGTVPHRVLKEH